MQSVVLNGALSQPLPVLSGVWQGSVLGSLLFLLHINEICDAGISIMDPTLYYMQMTSS